jgi:SNF2 family DNA or RNA helicase
MMLLERMVLGDGTGLGKTLEGIAAHSFALDQDPNIKLLVVCPKSATSQWAEEYEKFTTGITTRVISNEYKKLKGFEARSLQYQEFKEDVLIINYAPVLNEYEMIIDTLSPNFMVIFDEVQAFKNRKSKTHFACKFIAQSQRADRVYGMSATLIKNDLEEVWGVYDVLVPGLFGNITKFKSTYCKQKLMKLEIKGKTRFIPKIIGYKNLKQFKNTLDPYFLIRRKEEVAKELPKLISKKVVLEMCSEQKQLYKEALSGILHEDRVKSEYFEICDHIRAVGESNIDERTKKRYMKLKNKYEAFLTPDGKKRGKLAALTYCQMISNGPGLLNEPGESSKEEEFIRLMKEELLTEKVILFTRFKSGIPFLEIRCDRNGIDHTKITGDCSDRERKKARLKFQEDPNCKVILITTAGSAALNLQAAGVLIFYDTPWSYGDLVQTIGRAQRIGSLQDHILVIHMVNKGTIDEHVITKVIKKKDLSDAIVGDTAEGALDFVEHEESAVNDLYDNLLSDAEGYK